MLRIDRVSTEMEIVPDGRAAGRSPGDAPPPAPAAGDLPDSLLRHRLRDVVLDILSEHLRALERRGLV
jgi:hypothetical protein